MNKNRLKSLPDDSLLRIAKALQEECSHSLAHLEALK